MKRKVSTKRKSSAVKIPRRPPEEIAFAEMVEAYTSRPTTRLPGGQHGNDRPLLASREYVTRKIEAAEWGDGVVEQLALHLARTQPGLRGFTHLNLFRMRQFYSAYDGNTKVSALLRQLPWTHHLLILGQCKLAGEREFYSWASAYVTGKASRAWTTR